ncbi:MAG: 5-oxoprolinase subunit PxpB [Clostridia bacterium]|nr:5-oxoprolinase subunit PxpB [Clostridia bacterium]
MKDYRIFIEGDSSVLIVFGDTISAEINQRISSTVQLIRAQRIEGIVDMIPAFVSLLINYNPLVISYDALKKRLEKILQLETKASETVKRVFEIPVCYGGEYGPDLKNIAAHAGLSEREVIDIHTSCDYLIYMLGFLPGFCYLGGLDERIHTPRLETPRLKIPAGSVGIGGKQTGIYPMDSPGGWQLMGKTPVKTYDPERDPAILVQAGEYIRFVEIGEAEFKRIAGLVEKNEYQVTVREGGA